eukprot:scaffold114500_cov72-Phaeocystis_antarctica.AAC.2
MSTVWSSDKSQVGSDRSNAVESVYSERYVSLRECVPTPALAYCGNIFLWSIHEPFYVFILGDDLLYRARGSGRCNAYTSHEPLHTHTMYKVARPSRPRTARGRRRRAAVRPPRASRWRCGRRARSRSAPRAVGWKWRSAPCAAT